MANCRGSGAEPQAPAAVTADPDAGLSVGPAACVAPGRCLQSLSRSQLHISVRGSAGPVLGRAQSSTQRLSLRASPKPMEPQATQRGFYPLDGGSPCARREDRQHFRSLPPPAPAGWPSCGRFSSSFSKPLLTLSWQGLPGPFPAETVREETAEGGERDG